MTDGGKGSKPRPIPNPEQFRSNWDAIFKKNKEKQSELFDDWDEVDGNGAVSDRDSTDKS